MRKTKFAFLTLCLLGASPIFSTDVVNGSFEERLKGWRGRWVKKPTSFPRLLIDERNPAQGAKCLMFDVDGTGGRYQLTQKIRVEGGKKYIISFQLLIESSGKKQSCFRLQLLDGAGKFIAYACKTPLGRKTGKWERFEMELTTPVKTGFWVLEFNFHTPIKARLDAVFLRETTENMAK